MDSAVMTTDMRAQALGSRRGYVSTKWFHLSQFAAGNVMTDHAGCSKCYPSTLVAH